jgi:hypothetical protein
MRKYGPESFTIEEICSEVPVAILSIVEIAFIHIMGTFKNGQDYNSTIGGDGVGSGEDNPRYGAVGISRPGELNHFFGKKHSEETRAMLSAVKKGKPNFGIRGVPLSAETKVKLSIAHRGKKLSPEHIEKVAATKRGKPLSAEHRAKVAAALTGLKRSPDAVAKRLATIKANPKPSPLKGRKGRKWSPESIAKMIATTKANREAKLLLAA